MLSEWLINFAEAYIKVAKEEDDRALAMHINQAYEQIVTKNHKNNVQSLVGLVTIKTRIFSFAQWDLFAVPTCFMAGLGLLGFLERSEPAMKTVMKSNKSNKL